MLCFHHHQHKLSYIMYIQPLLRKLTFRPLNQKKFMYTTKFKNIFFLNFAFISNTLKDLPHITNENCAFFIYFFLYACHDRELYFMICMSSKKKIYFVHKEPTFYFGQIHISSEFKVSRALTLTFLEIHLLFSVMYVACHIFLIFFSSFIK